MLSNIKNDLVHCLNILESIEKIFLYAQNCNDAEELYNLNDQLNFNAVLTLLTNIGETVAKISLDIKEKHPAILCGNKLKTLETELYTITMGWIYLLSMIL